MNRQPGSEPLYLKLYKKLVSDISEGLYRSGEKLPSKRVISDNTGLSLVTVEHALELLADEGYVVSKERSGCYVSFSPGQYGLPSSQPLPDRSRTGILNAPERIEPAFSPMKAEDLPSRSFPFTAWAKTVRQILTERERKIFEKSHNRGHAELRNALSEFLARSRQPKCSPEDIIIGAGSEYLYVRLIQLLGRDRIYAVESPSYEMISKVYTAENVDFEMLKIGSGGILSRELASTKASVLHVTPYRSFPSGATAQVGKRMEYIKWAAAEGRYIIEDDVESEFSVLSKKYDPLFTLSSSDNVIYMNSFSVTLSPALRIAYMVLPEKLSEEYRARLDFYSCPVPTFEQLVLARFIRSGEFERYINRVRREKRSALRQSERSSRGSR